MKGDHPADPKALIREAYRIEGISEPECRIIFLDWALGLPEGWAQPAAVEAMLEFYGAGAPDHPMTSVLRAGLLPGAAPRRRGGWRGRREG
ncbi:hypothetical protein [Pseudodonghicola xiamenensis]|uniref:Uncharacterized protein n=1 Tax=Pseudodonghicola xiamenensis TaxID=337702 RepID=A0A8J3MAV5_9RHOB|nr:hypothetical protein [Pseudodonghicola xiamenensis]GHG79983.1 hypothetical protein GCM10010961_02610 [Pseudodonghicola xiamenensis]